MYKLKSENTYSSCDLMLCAAISLYFPVWAVDKSDLNKVLFIFKREPELDGLLENFWKGQLRVNPIEYFNQIKILKSRLYEK